MKFPHTQALFSYWVRQCRGRSAPDRYDLDPAEMRGVLPYTFILDVGSTCAGTSYTIRLSGTRLDALFGRSLRGENFLDILAEQDREDASALLSDVLDDAQPIVAGLRGAPRGCQETSFELLILPLRHHGRTHERVLCSLAPAATPPWIGLQPIADLSLSSWRFVDRCAELDRVAIPAVAQHPHLTVIEGGRFSAPLVPRAQARVKASVAHSKEMYLVTRRS